MMICATKARIIGPIGMRRFPSGPWTSASVQPSAESHCLLSTPYHTAPTSQPATAATRTAMKLIAGMLFPQRYFGAVPRRLPKLSLTRTPRLLSGRAVGDALLHRRIHVFGAQKDGRLGADQTARADSGRKRGCGHRIRQIADHDCVVVAERPIGRFQLAPSCLEKSLNGIHAAGPAFLLQALEAFGCVGRLDHIFRHFIPSIEGCILAPFAIPNKQAGCACSAHRLKARPSALLLEK